MNNKAIDTTPKACPLCGDHRVRSLFTGRDFLHGFEGEFALVSCFSCGLWRLNATSDSSGYYPANYKAYEDNRPVRPVLREKLSHRLRKGHVDWLRSGRPSWAHLPLQRLVRLAPARLLTLLARYRFNPFAYKTERESVLDVGCADGHFLAEMAALGWTPRGVERNPEAATRARERGIRVVNQDLVRADEKDLPDNSFDLVTMRQVLEHFDDPFGAVATACRVLKPGGFLAVWTPITSGLAPVLFGKYWYNLDLPRHRVIFSKKTLIALVRQAGLIPVEAHGLSSSKSLVGSFGFWAGQRFGPNARHKVFNSTGLNWIARFAAAVLDIAGQGDNLLLLARKPVEEQNAKPTEQDCERRPA